MNEFADVILRERKSMSDTKSVSVSQIFSLQRSEQKPRTKNQLWIKDVGYDEAPWYSERMGLPELKDIMEVAGESIESVKIAAGVGASRKLVEAQNSIVSRTFNSTLLGSWIFCAGFSLGRC